MSYSWALDVGASRGLFQGVKGGWTHPESPTAHSTDLAHGVNVESVSGGALASLGQVPLAPGVGQGSLGPIPALGDLREIRGNLFRGTWAQG